jgi:hypothetical protein
MGRRLVGGVLVAIGLIAASLAWTGYAASRTVLDPGRSQAIADDLYQDREVRAQLRSSMADAMARALPEGVSASRSELVAAADRALDDPAVEELFTGAMIRAHHRFLGEDPAPDEPIVVEGAALAAASRTALINARPELATVVPEAPSLPVTLPTERIPDAGGFRAWLNGAVAMLTAIAVGFVAAAFVLTNDRPRVLRRVGFWAIGAGAFWLLVGVVLPVLAHLLMPGQAAIFSALIGVAAGGMIPPSINAVVAGVAAVLVSLLWSVVASLSGRRRAPAPPRRERRRERAAEPDPAPSAYPPTPRRPATPQQAAAAYGVAPSRPAPPPRPAPQAPTAAAPAPATPFPNAPRWVEGVGYVDDEDATTADRPS